MRKKLNALAGFTLAELLIVVAIIAVLVAISIPIFSAKLEASRESTDAANLRSAYAAAASALLIGKSDEAPGEDADNPANVLDFLTNASITCIYTKQGKLVQADNADENTQGMTGKSIVNGWQGTEITDLPEGVYLQCKVDATVAAPTGTGNDVGNSQRGEIYVILNNNPGTDGHEIEVFFYKAPTTTTTP